MFGDRFPRRRVNGDLPFDLDSLHSAKLMEVEDRKGSDAGGVEPVIPLDGIGLRREAMLAESFAKRRVGGIGEADDRVPANPQHFLNDPFDVSNCLQGLR